jgi:hypothetical protein
VRTENGLIGLIPKLARVDDEIFVLAGGDVLHVLRLAGAQCPGKYQCVGERYPHGIMDGAALERLEKGIASVTKVELM